ncbi:hypothetical protein FB45DRAFT_947927 [Roridomyces roridus]|uniref:Uncharacterized protein n=1 Tax=Roridomyces roridus TaxID=1738132 RepID=A0AAD7F9U4_9AGAR|nr:hypothetical protein FB45DRAFT_947927 [Roridomyces roridus]
MLLPQELVDLVVQNIADDKESLRSCSLAARPFVRPTQVHLFKKIEILPPTPHKSGDNPCQKFQKTIASSPHLATLVHELRIVLVGSETSFAIDAEGSYTSERRPTWIMSGRTLALVLPALIRIKRISIIEDSPLSWNADGQFTMNWHKLGRSLRSALTAVFSSPHLESVHIRGLLIHSPKELLSLFSEATSLKSLTLGRVFFAQEVTKHEPWPESKPWRPRLESLSMSSICGQPFCFYLVNPQIDLSRVTSLTSWLGVNNQWRSAVCQPPMSDNIRDLGIFSPNGDISGPVLTQNLRSLRIFTLVLNSAMMTVFQGFPQDSRLETMAFDTVSAVSDAAQEALLNQAIDTAIPRLKSLKTVEIRLIPAGDRSFSECEATTRSYLTALEGRGLLRLTQWRRAALADWE